MAACEELVNIKLGFQNIHGISQCCGAIDCTYILFNKPLDTNSVDWFDRNYNYSMILQTIVDSKSIFINVFAGFPSFVHNSRIFSCSNHQLLVTNGKRLNGVSINIRGVDVYEFIIGDTRYMISQHMFVPRSGQRLSSMFQLYNFKHSSTRMCVEHAFGILQGVWRILKRPMTHVHLQNVSSLIITCCILHNIVIDINEIIDKSLLFWGYHDEKISRL